ncbi:DUF1499 domain-containing protein [Pseudoruegeria sp. SHC-113]|uniref:DUF1499 domain-containing protein n=1 Tax=Pseudoruegeria sp. SHC-113 TaxID=2855439 RepID=UPI0021BB00EC|nr:DUF1499 domain-containing protein [Pseudoruegeria sp. SHC-113]MCT8160615.1 DUF1499 domain-containing protein [Pseudoruegeria sp. SHC-113]
MKTALILLLAVLAVAMLYVRLAPIDAQSWHQDPDTAPDPGVAGVRIGSDDARAPQGEAATLLAALNNIALATPRTRVIAGSVADGMITYETRSLLWGFPDYTTVKLAPQADGSARLAILARLRFGRSDLGVNGKRVAAWLQALEAVQQAG